MSWPSFWKVEGTTETLVLDSDEYFNKQYLQEHLADIGYKQPIIGVLESFDEDRGHSLMIATPFSTIELREESV